MKNPTRRGIAVTLTGGAAAALLTLAVPGAAVAAPRVYADGPLTRLSGERPRGPAAGDDGKISAAAPHAAAAHDRLPGGSA